MASKIKETDESLRAYFDHCRNLRDLGNNEESKNALILTIEDYYRQQGRVCFRRSEIMIHATIIDGKTCDESYSVKYIIDRKRSIRYFIPIDTRNFYAMLCLGVGPEYEDMRSLVSESNQKKFSMESTKEAIENNLSMLDEYLAGRLQ